MLRLVTAALALTLTVYLTAGWKQFAPFIGVFSTPYLAFCVLLFGLTYLPQFERVWQGATVGLAWLTSAATLLWVANSQSPPPATAADPNPTVIITHLFFRLQVCVLIVGLAALRLQFRPALALQSGIAATGALIAVSAMPVDQNLLNGIERYFEPVLLVLLCALLSSFVQEQLSRSAFEANRRLALLQAQERQKRVETEKMLHILNMAIGGIVHDLGNPLAKVQMGAQTLDMLLDDEPEPELVRDITAAISNGADMLNFLRLSLIEQSRVLEGKPVPVELKPVPVLAIVEAGATFQKPRAIHSHTVTFDEQPYTIRGDEMKMVTVLMNLIGNALKYAHGQVHITWQPHGPLLLLAVMDQGHDGRGLTREQAGRLFTAFGRLEAHEAIEGTGLGLLSVQKIVEAHGGEVWIEGFDDAAGTTHFSTARGDYPKLLRAPFRTTFALSCPLADEI